MCGMFMLKHHTNIPHITFSISHSRNVYDVENVMWRMFVVWNVYGVENVMCGMFVVWNVCGVENVMCGMFVVR